jgi:RNA polymerase sigma-70 factor (ECF subfamily)
MAAMARARLTGLALLDGEFGLVMTERGRPRLVLAFAFGTDGRITRIDVVAEPERLRATEIAVAGLGHTGGGDVEGLDQ